MNIKYKVLLTFIIFIIATIIGVICWYCIPTVPLTQKYELYDEYKHGHLPIKLVPKVIYINLDKRKDRNKQILGELNNFSNNYLRLSATFNEIGALGCSMSHIRCLEYAIKNNLENILVLEDDFKFIRNKKEITYIINNFINTEENWDVLLLSCNREKRSPYSKDIDRVKNSQTTSGYLVNKHYYQKLLDNYKLGYSKLKETNNQSKYAIDQYWKLLQKPDNWFVIKAGIQRASYSDIQKANVDYKV
jgi:glycosyl transferase family 25